MVISTLHCPRCGVILSPCCCLQPWEGDITVVLPAHLWNLGKSIVNPTTNDIINATRQVRSYSCWGFVMFTLPP
jgi:hypothetical protein